MGLYIDTPDKSGWLRANASPISREAAAAINYSRLDKTIPLAAMQNPWGVSIAILFSRPEADRFLAGRSDAQFYLADREAVKQWWKK